MFVGGMTFAILKAFYEAAGPGFDPEKLLLTTADIRQELDGKDPHPTLGRMRDRDLLFVTAGDYWALTELGAAVFYAGAVEREMRSSGT